MHSQASRHERSNNSGRAVAAGRDHCATLLVLSSLFRSSLLFALPILSTGNRTDRTTQPRASLPRLGLQQEITDAGTRPPPVTPFHCIRSWGGDLPASAAPPASWVACAMAGRLTMEVQYVGFRSL